MPVSESVNEFIGDSLLYHIEADTSDFIHKARCLEIDEDRFIVLYDRGEFSTACKAYWGFRATGHDETRILIGGLKACEDYGLELNSGVPAEVSQAEPYLPFNNTDIISYADFVKKETYYQQIICAEKANFELLDVKGKMISEAQLIKNLDSVGVVCQSNKATIVHGKAAAVVGVLLRYLGHRGIAVVLDSTEGFVSAKKNRGSGYVKTVEIEKTHSPRNSPGVESGNIAKQNHQSVEEEKKIQTKHQAVEEEKNGKTEHLIIEEGKNGKNKNQPIEEQSRCICSCLIF